MLKSAAKQVFRLLPSSVKTQLRQTYHSSIEDYRLRSAFKSLGITKMEQVNILHLLHALRGQSLEKLPQGVEHFVSVGCSGTWYFNWIDEKCRPRHHTGIEFYLPKPNDLPSNTTWITNTAGDMRDLGNDVADLLFSGQNIEHLWTEDVTNFLLESHRVLKPGGLLVIDSPNRRMTAKLQWNQPEHTLEFDVDEILELLHLAGFDLTAKRGIWQCEDPETGAVLPFEALDTSGNWPLTRRATEANDNLPSSFIWWVEAKKSTRAPQIERLKARVREIYEIAWPERLTRLMSVIGSEVRRDGAVWLDSASRPGPLLYGPYVPLRAGRYTARFTLHFPDGLPGPERTVAICDVVAGDNGAIQLGRREIRAADVENGLELQAEVDFTVADTVFAAEFRVHTVDGVRVHAKKSIALQVHGGI